MLVVKSVPRAVRSKSLFAALSVLLMIAATLFGANVASGDEVWNQSYQRASQSEECVAQPGETPWQDSWGTNPGWSPSWEQWANNGHRRSRLLAFRLAKGRTTPDASYTTSKK